MAFVKKTWKDRVAEYINRRTLVKEDGTTELVTVERSEGTISQEGDAFSASNMNDLEQRIADEFSELNSNLNADGTPFRFGKDSDGNFGYILTDETGADSVIPFKKQISKFVTLINSSDIVRYGFSVNVPVGKLFLVCIRGTDSIAANSSGLTKLVETRIDYSSSLVYLCAGITTQTTVNVSVTRWNGESYNSQHQRILVGYFE